MSVRVAKVPINLLRLSAAATTTTITSLRACHYAAGKKAADCLYHAAGCETKLGNQLRSAATFAEAGELMERADPAVATKYFSRAIEAYALQGYYPHAAVVCAIACAHAQARLGELPCIPASPCFPPSSHPPQLEEHIAHMLMHEEDADAAAEHFDNAAEYWATAAQYGMSIRALLDGAAAMIETQRYVRAAKRYGHAAKLCLDDNLLKFNSSRLHLSTVLCLLAGLKLAEAKQYVMRLKDDFLWEASREKRFAMDVLYCCQEADQHLFMDHVWNFDYVEELTDSQLAVCEVIYEAIVTSAPADADDLEDNTPYGEILRAEKLAAELDKAVANDSESDWSATSSEYYTSSSSDDSDAGGGGDDDDEGGQAAAALELATASSTSSED